MAKMKTFKCHCIGGGMPAIEVYIDAINPPQAVKFAEGRYPGYNRYYSSGQVSN